MKHALRRANSALLKAEKKFKSTGYAISENDQLTVYNLIDEVSIILWLPEDIARMREKLLRVLGGTISESES